MYRETTRHSLKRGRTDGKAVKNTHTHPHAGGIIFCGGVRFRVGCRRIDTCTDRRCRASFFRPQFARKVCFAHKTKV